MTDEQPNKFSHPLYQPMWLKFKTPEVVALDSQIKQWIHCGITGAIILGDARTGKTTASEILCNTYVSRRDGKPIPGHRFTVSKLDKRTIGNCWRRLYVSTGGEESLTYRESDKYISQIENYFTDLAMINEEHVVVLFPDECQRLSIDQLDVFADLQNSLRDRGVTLLIYFIGNRAEYSKTLEIIQAEEYDHLRGRFFGQQYYFCGIHTLEQVEACLSYYDTTRYPEENGPTYTEFFLPKEFAMGWRLESQAKLIWMAYKNCAAKAKRDTWGMKYFVGTINPLLTDYLPEFGVHKLNINMVQRCIDVSGFLPQLVKTVEP
jgi:hypothetical protein